MGTKREEALDIIKAEGITAVEFGAGAYPGTSHLGGSNGSVEKLIESKAERDKLMKESREPGIDDLGHLVPRQSHPPRQNVAEDHHRAFVNSVKLASALAPLRERIQRVSGGRAERREPQTG